MIVRRANWKGKGYLGIFMISPGKIMRGKVPEIPSQYNYLSLRGSCLVRWDNDTLMLISGGYWDSKKTYFINYGATYGAITEGPTLKKKRYYSACQEMVVNGEEFVIVAGGNWEWNSVEVLSKKYPEKGWQLRNWDLPSPQESSLMVSSADKKNLYIMLPDTPFTSSHTIEKFSCEEDIKKCKWTRLGTKLKIKRGKSLAVPIPDGFAKKLCDPL